MPTFFPGEIRALNDRLQNASTDDILRWAWTTYGPLAAIGTSFQGAGLVMMHLAKKSGLPFSVFTIDTGLLFPETVALKERLEKFLGHPIEALVPDWTVDQQSAAHGPELWRRDPDLCCTIRKVLPLQAKLSGLSCWITGLRREQSEGRSGVGVVELYIADETTGRHILKLNPMAQWSRAAVWDYLKTHGIPYNPLHDQGYRSIGCRPCTARADAQGSERAGRWTGFNKTECGIHTFMPKADFQI